MKYTFKKNQRLLNKSSFTRIVSADNKRVGAFIRIYYQKISSIKPKLGITASSYFGNAIERNFFKRQIREVFRQNQHRIDKSLQVVIYPQKSAKNASYRDLQEEFLLLLSDT